MNRSAILRSRLGLALALVAGAVVLAGAGALGPAHRLTATYAWPPATLTSSETPARFWYSPLLLTRGTAAELHATIPCNGLAAPLRDQGSESLVLATMRHPRTGQGLEVVQKDKRLSFRFGDSTFGTAPLSSNAACSAIALEVRGDQWTLRLSSAHTETGNFGARPRVTGLFSGLDLRAGARPRIVVTTDPYGAHAAWWQWPAWAAAIALALGALVVCFGASRPRPPAPVRVRGSIGRLIRSLRPVDGLVLLFVGTWWLIGPVLYDDGWVKARQTNGIIGDGFSNYYTTYGVNLPLDFWTEWLQHWVVARSNTLIILRLPTVLLLAATWIVCRTLLNRLLEGTRARAAAEWALALAFVLNTFSWGITLRPEPFVALLLVSVLAIALRFTEQPSGWSLAAAGMLVALALAAHPAGLITVAPLLAIGPHVVRWVRGQNWTAPVVVGGAILAMFLTVVTVGSDLHQRLSEARLARTAGEATASWRGELSRYEFAGGVEGTTLRHLSVALMLAALIGYLARGRRPSRLDVPSLSLAFTLVLLIATPSKWAWHFGALAGLAALVVAVEITRLRADGETLNWPIRPLLAFGVAILVVSWSLGFTDDWSSGFGLRTLSWTFGFEGRVTLVRLGLVGFALVFAGFALLAWVRHGRAGLWRSPWSMVPWLVPLVVLPLVVLNIAMLAADAVKTPAWTLAAQNVESLQGREGCGLADDTQVAAPWSLRPLRPLGSNNASSAPQWLSPTNPPSRPAFGLLGRRNLTRSTLPWFRAPGDRRVGFYVLGTNDADDRVLARWGRAPSLQPVPSGSWSNIDLTHFDAFQTETIQWAFVPQSLLPARTSGQNAVQLGLESDARPPHALAATGAVSYESTKLSTLLRLQGARALVWPNLLLYMPCARQPRLAKGVVEVPTMLVTHSGFFPLEVATAPFHGLVDLYGFRDLGVADSRVDPQGVTVLWVERRIPGAAIARAQTIDS